ncbi:MAG: hypothetical protein MJ185_02850 [Treponema sp.]|nr:hypothetical protein [Treponema sp.]
MRFNFFKSLKNDYGLFLSFTGFLISTAFFLFLSVGPASYRLIDFQTILDNGFKDFRFTDSFAAIIFGFLILISLFCFIKRICYVRSFGQEECTKVTAKVTDINYVKDRCGVDMEFIFGGETVKKHFALMNNGQTKYIHMDSEVELLVKNCNPKKAIIISLFFDEE